MSIQSQTFVLLAFTLQFHGNAFDTSETIFPLWPFTRKGFFSFYHTEQPCERLSYLYGCASGAHVQPSLAAADYLETIR